MSNGYSLRDIFIDVCHMFIPEYHVLHIEVSRSPSDQTYFPDVHVSVCVGHVFVYVFTCGLLDVILRVVYQKVCLT